MLLMFCYWKKKKKKNRKKDLLSPDHNRYYEWTILNEHGHGRSQNCKWGSSAKMARAHRDLTRTEFLHPPHLTFKLHHHCDLLMTVPWEWSMHVLYCTALWCGVLHYVVKRLTLTGIISEVERKTNRWKSDMATRNSLGLNRCMYLTRAPKSCNKQTNPPDCLGVKWYTHKKWAVTTWILLLFCMCCVSESGCNVKQFTFRNLGNLQQPVFSESMNLVKKKFFLISLTPPTPESRKQQAPDPSKTIRSKPHIYIFLNKN